MNIIVLNKNIEINGYLNKATTLCSALFIFVFFGFPIVNLANTENLKERETSVKSIEILVTEVLRRTEMSLSLVKLNTPRSLVHVNEALSSIKKIKNKLSPDTHAESMSPLMMNNSKEYWFTYPSVSKEIINNSDAFPTLHSKLNSNILYRGNAINKSEKNYAAYFDYAFAYASLLTAREALSVNNYREATSSLKWVFEAIYLSPDFHVVKFDNKLKIDPLLNLNGDFPHLSNNTKEFTIAK